MLILTLFLSSGTIVLRFLFFVPFLLLLTLLLAACGEQPLHQNHHWWNINVGAEVLTL